MGLTPVPRKISDIFSNHKYDIDFYQREYKWNDKQPFKPVKSLLDDIFYRFELEYSPNLDNTQNNIANYEWYFLNAYMTNEHGGKTFIVDGQQRLTTLTLIIMKLMHMSKIYGLEQNVVDFLSNSVCGPGIYGKQFWLGFDDRKGALEDIYEHDISFAKKPNGLSETNIYENYRVLSSYFDEKIKQRHKLEAFYKYFFERIQLIEIKIDKPKDVAMVFEVINDRGVPLTAYEILKGKLLGWINKNDVDSYVDIWEKAINLIQEFNEIEIDEFFSTYFRAKYSDSNEQYRRLETDKYHRTIFVDDFNKKIDLRHNEFKVKEFITGALPYYSSIYRNVLNEIEEYPTNKDYEFIYFNNVNDQDGQFLLILAAIDLNDPDYDKKVVLVSKLFERNFVILNLTGSYKANIFNEDIIKLSRDIRNASLVNIKKHFDKSLLEGVNKAHDTNYPYGPFRYNFFKSIGYKSLSKKFLRYFYARIDTFIGNEASLPTKTYHQMVQQSKGNDIHHIDHILANHPANIALFDDEDEFNNERNRLGALVLIKGKENMASGNELYHEKLKTYSGKGTLFAQTLRKDFYHKNIGFKNFYAKYNLAFIHYDDYNKTSIEERQKLLFQICKIIWEV